ncbi:hypothetical protein Tco_0044897 [Tanacetum coccineum]
MNKPSQTPREQCNTSGTKKNDVEPTIEVDNLNPFDVLNSVENDVDLGTNDGNSDLASKKTNSRKVTLVDDEGKPLENVDSSDDHDSEDEVEYYVNGDNDFDLYDDDMYEDQDIPDKIQDICDNLDIKVRGCKKKYLFLFLLQCSYFVYIPLKKLFCLCNGRKCETHLNPL